MVAYASLHRNNIGRVTRADKASARGVHLRMIIGSISQECAAPSARESSLVASILRRAAQLALAACIGAVVTACGSGAVGPAPTPPGPPGPISISPSTATVFSGAPTTFIVTGGNGNYVITSDNQSVIPFIPTFSGNTVTVIPGDVAADTTVTLTVRDTAASAPATAKLTVKGRILSNVVTVTPTTTACGTAVCAGGDAEVKVTLSQSGLPIANRQVQFDVLSGDFRIITGSSGGTETLATTGTAFTDSTGTARIRIRVLDQASSQTALLQITDFSSGTTLRTSFAIAPSSNGALNAQPATLTFTGPDAATCANGITADVIVFGGRAPYSISNPGTFNVNPLIVGSSGGRFSVAANGQCTAGSRIAVVDANGASVTVTATNSLGADHAGTPFVVSPTTVTLNSCAGIATVALAGGQGASNNFGASGSNVIFAQAAGNFGFIRRQGGTDASTLPVDANGVSTVLASFSDGKTTVPVTVQLVGPGRGSC